MNRYSLTAASWLLVLTGLALLGFYGTSLALATQGHRDGLAAFETLREARREAAAAAAGTQDSAAAVVLASATERPATSGEGGFLARLAEPDMTHWSEKRIAEYRRLLAAAQAADLPEGILRIPSVDLELPVFSGTQEANMTRGAGRLQDTAPLGEPGNTAIAAHRDGYFRALKDVRLGDEILVETLDGPLRYEIVDLSIVEPDDVSVLDPTPGTTITLVTCYPFYFVGSAPQRYIVRAELR